MLRSGDKVQINGQGKPLTVGFFKPLNNVIATVVSATDNDGLVGVKRHPDDNLYWVAEHELTVIRRSSRQNVNGYVNLAYDPFSDKDTNRRAS